MAVVQGPGGFILQKALVITGKDEVLKNLNKEIAGIKNRGKKGIIASAMLVGRKSKIECPVGLTSNLINSQYRAVFDSASGPVAEVGYTTEYAPYVHEIQNPHFPDAAARQSLAKRTKRRKKAGKPPTRIGWQKQGSKPGFLRDPLYASQKEVLDLVRKYADVDTGKNQAEPTE